MGDALTAFDEVINHMPESEAAFNLAKEALIAGYGPTGLPEPEFSMPIRKQRTWDWTVTAGKCYSTICRN